MSDYLPLFTLSIADWIFLIDTFLKPCEKSTNIHTAELNIYVVPSFAYSLRLADPNFVYHISTACGNTFGKCDRIMAYFSMTFCVHSRPKHP